MGQGGGGGPPRTPSQFKCQSGKGTLENAEVEAWGGGKANGGVAALAPRGWAGVWPTLGPGLGPCLLELLYPRALAVAT